MRDQSPAEPRQRLLTTAPARLANLHDRIATVERRLAQIRDAIGSFRDANSRLR